MFSVWFLLVLASLVFWASRNGFSFGECLGWPGPVFRVGIAWACAWGKNTTRSDSQFSESLMMLIG